MDPRRNRHLRHAQWPNLTSVRLKDVEVASAIAAIPGIAEPHRRNVAKLTEMLNAPELAAGEARAMLRNLVEFVTTESKQDGKGVNLVVHGRLAQIL